MRRYLEPIDLHGKGWRLTGCEGLNLDRTAMFEKPLPGGWILSG